MSLEVGGARGMLIQSMFDWPDPENKESYAKKMVKNLESQFSRAVTVDPLLIYEVGSAIRNNFNPYEIDLFSSGVAAYLSTELPHSEKRKIPPQIAYFSYQFYTTRPPSRKNSSEYYPSMGKMEILTILACLRDDRLDQVHRNKFSSELPKYYDGNQLDIMESIAQIISWTV